MPDFFDPPEPIVDSFADYDDWLDRVDPTSLDPYPPDVDFGNYSEALTEDELLEMESAEEQSFDYFNRFIAGDR